MGGKMKAADRRKRRISAHRWVRFAIQVIFFILAPAFFAAAFNGVKYIFAQLGASEPIEASAFLIMLVAILAFTVIFGRFFCGFACAFGTLGDVIFAIFDFLRSKTPMKKVEFPDPLVRALSIVKFLILAVICVMCFFGVWQILSGYSPWVSFAGIVAGSVEGISLVAFIMLGLVVVLMALRERSFCQFLCPLGALFSLMPVLGFSSYKRNRSCCIPKCGRCKGGCPVDIWPDPDMVHGECISCGRCADICPISNISLMELKSKSRGDVCTSDETKVAAEGDAVIKNNKTINARECRSITGTEVPLTLVKAALLLLMFWILGATRYIPSFENIASMLGFGG